MKYANGESSSAGARPAGGERVNDGEFQNTVLEKLGRLEAKVDMIVGNGQPGRMRLAEERVAELEKNDLRRAVYDRIVIAGITFTITLAIGVIVAWRNFFGM
jgi:hypothetical protein